MSSITIRLNKYKNYIFGTTFVLLAFPFILWGFHIVTEARPTYFEIIIPIVGIVLCLLISFYFMLKEDSVK